MDDKEEIAPTTNGQINCCTHPDFLEILSFFDKFGTLLELPSPVLLSDLKAGAETQKTTAEWRLLHCQLLRRIIKTFKAERWTQELLKVCAKYGIVAENVEGGYTNLPYETKLMILKLLCDLQFSYNTKFKEKLDELEGIALRTESVGRDKNGNSYYYFQDSECNIFLYSAPQSTLEKFDLLASNREELESTVARLKDEIEVKEIKENIETSEKKENETESKPVSERAASAASNSNALPESSEQQSTSSRATANGNTESRPTSAISDKDSIDLDTPEKARGGNSPVVAPSSTRSRGRPKNATPVSTSPPASARSSSLSTKAPSKGAKSKKTTKAAKSKAKSTPSKGKSKGAVKNGKASATPSAKKNGAASKKSRAEVSSSDSDDDSSNSESKKSDSSSDSSSEEEELSLSTIKATSGRTPRAAQIKAVAKLATPKAGKGKITKKESSSDDDDEEEEAEESEDEEEYVPASAKRGRGRGKAAPAKVAPPPKPGKRKAPSPVPIDSSDVEDDTECRKCHRFNHPGKLLLCDKCDTGYHTFCLVPAIVLIPEGEWFCPVCEHLKLVERLEEIVTKLDIAQKELAKKHARERAGRKELSKLMEDPWRKKRPERQREDRPESKHTSGNESDGGEFGVRSCRRRNKIDYSMADFDKKINDAITGRGKEEQSANPRPGGRRERVKNEEKGSGDEGNNKDDDDYDDDYNSDDYALPGFEDCKDEGDSTPRKNRSRSRQSDEEYKPSDDDGEERAPRKRKRPQSYDDEEDYYEPSPEPPPRKPKKKLPKNWEEEEYHTSWDDQSDSEDWDSDAMSDFGGRKRRGGGQKRPKKRRRFLYASSDSDSDNVDYDDYKRRSKQRHKHRSGRKVSESENSEESEEESDSGSEYGGRRRKKPAVAKSKSKSKSRGNNNGASSFKDDEVRGSARLAARGRIDYSKYVDDDEERKAKKKKAEQQSVSGKIRRPFEEEEEEGSNEDDFDEEEEDDDERKSSPEVKAIPKGGRLKVIASDEEDEEEDDKKEKAKKKNPVADEDEDEEQEEEAEEPEPDEEEEDEEEESEEEVKPKYVPAARKTIPISRPAAKPAVKVEEEEKSREANGSFKEAKSEPVVKDVKLPATTVTAPARAISGNLVTSSTTTYLPPNSFSSVASLPPINAAPPVSKPANPMPYSHSVSEPSVDQSMASPVRMPVSNNRPPAPYGMPQTGGVVPPPMANVYQSQQGLGSPMAPQQYNPHIPTGAYPPYSQSGYPSPNTRPGMPMSPPVVQQGHLHSQSVYGYGAPMQQQPQQPPSHYMPQTVSRSPYFQQPSPAAPLPHMPPQAPWQSPQSYSGGYDVPPIQPPAVQGYHPSMPRPPAPVGHHDGMAMGSPRPPYMGGPQMPSSVAQPPMPAAAPNPAPAGGAFDDFDLEDLGPSAPRAEPVQ